MENARRVAGVAHQSGIAKVTFVGLADRPGVAHSVFSALAEHHVHADLIVQNIGHHGRTDLSFTVDEEDLSTALSVSKEVQPEVDAQDVTAKAGLAKVSVVGTGIGSSLEYAAIMFGALSNLGVNIDIISTSGIRITCVIDGEQVEGAVRALHSAFELSDEETARVQP